MSRLVQRLATHTRILIYLFITTGPRAMSTVPRRKSARGTTSQRCLYGGSCRNRLEAAGRYRQLRSDLLENLSSTVR